MITEAWTGRLNCKLLTDSVILTNKSHNPCTALIEIFRRIPTTARPRDTRILVPEKNRAAQNRAS